MLSVAITVLFTITGLIAAAVIAHSLRAAHAAWQRLVREGEVLRAGLALQASATPMSLRPRPAPAPRRRVAMRQAPLLRHPQRPAFAAA